MRDLTAASGVSIESIEFMSCNKAGQRDLVDAWLSNLFQDVSSVSSLMLFAFQSKIAHARPTGDSPHGSSRPNSVPVQHG